MKLKVKEYLQIGRAQTFSADWLLVIVAFLCGRFNVPQALLLTVILWFGHLLTFGHNSLLDACTVATIGDLPYDAKDPNKKHFPLISGSITLHSAKIIILSGLCILALSGIIFTWFFASNLPLALIAYFIYWVFGISYNEGLSKETPLSFIPITICFSGLAAWGWFLGHTTLDTIGLLYVLNVAFIQLFEIGVEGNLKELPAAGLVERRNWLNVLGGKYENGKFKSSLGVFLYGFIVKALGLSFGWTIISMNFTFARGIWGALLTPLIWYLFNKLISTRVYNRKNELINMSLMEIASIFFVIPILLDWITASILMTSAIIYFFIMNLWLWKMPAPKV